MYGKKYIFGIKMYNIPRHQGLAPHDSLAGCGLIIP